MISNGRVHINFISERVRILIARFKYADRGDISFRPPIVEYRMGTGPINLWIISNIRFSSSNRQLVGEIETNYWIIRST